MKREVGLWINHTKAIIVTITGAEDELRQVRSNIESHIRFSGGSLANPLYGTSNISGEGKQSQMLKNCLTAFYDNVVLMIRNADSVWIFGPGEAKTELMKHLKREKFFPIIVGTETLEKLTDRQFTTKIRQLYLKSPSS